MGKQYQVETLPPLYVEKKSSIDTPITSLKNLMITNIENDDNCDEDTFIPDTSVIPDAQTYIICDGVNKDKVENEEISLKRKRSDDNYRNDDTYTGDEDINNSTKKNTNTSNNNINSKASSNNNIKNRSDKNIDNINTNNTTTTMNSNNNRTDNTYNNDKNMNTEEYGVLSFKPSNIHINHLKRRNRHKSDNNHRSSLLDNYLNKVDDLARQYIAAGSIVDVPKSYLDFSSVSFNNEDFIPTTFPSTSTSSKEHSKEHSSSTSSREHSKEHSPSSTSSTSSMSIDWVDIIGKICNNVTDKSDKNNMNNLGNVNAKNIHKYQNSKNNKNKKLDGICKSGMLPCIVLSVSDGNVEDSVPMISGMYVHICPILNIYTYLNMYTCTHLTYFLSVKYISRY